MEKLSSVLQEFRHMLKPPLLLRLPSTPPKKQQQQELGCADSPVGDSEPVGSEDGSRFFDGNSQVWNRYPDVARYNPPRQTLPLPFCFYGQPFYKGFSWETKNCVRLYPNTFYFLHKCCVKDTRHFSWCQYWNKNNLYEQLRWCSVCDPGN